MLASKAECRYPPARATTRPPAIRLLGAAPGPIQPSWELALAPASWGLGSPATALGEWVGAGAAC